MAIETSNEIELTTFEDVRLALINEDLTRSLDPERHERGNILDQVLMVLHGDAHRVRRRVENRLFRRETLLRYERQLFPDIIRSTLARIGLGRPRRPCGPRKPAHRSALGTYRGHRLRE